MRATVLVVVILAVVIHTWAYSTRKESKAEQEARYRQANECSSKCYPEQNKIPKPSQMVCSESGYEHRSRCNFNCHEFYDEVKPGDLMEAKCKNGTIGHCFHTECTEDERIDFTYLDRGFLFCEKEFPHYKVFYPCFEKCESKVRDKKEVEYMRCKDVKFG